MTKNEIYSLINNVCEKGFNSSTRNAEKIRNCGFKIGERIHLFDNYSMSLFAGHGGIRKVFYKGNRMIKRSTVLCALETRGNE